jgi:hypothetical protein
VVPGGAWTRPDRDLIERTTNRAADRKSFAAGPGPFASSGLLARVLFRHTINRMMIYTIAGDLMLRADALRLPGSLLTEMPAVSIKQLLLML